MRIGRGTKAGAAAFALTTLLLAGTGGWAGAIGAHSHGIAVGQNVAAATRGAGAHAVQLGPDLARWTAPATTPAPAPTTARGGDAVAAVRKAEQVTFNWAGEIASASSFTSVKGSWTVPAVTPTSGTQDSATWVGIGGASRSATGLIQTGTEQYTSTGFTTYSAWYEIVPGPSITIDDPTTGLPEPVAPGDRMTAEVVRQSSGQWLIQLQDATKGWVARHLYTYSGTALSAEWIEEAPSLDANPSSIETLADFHSVRFTDMVDSTSGAQTLDPVIMRNFPGAVIAYPGPVKPTTTRSVSVYFGAPTTAQETAPQQAPTPPSRTSSTGPPPFTSGYDLVGADGGVFVFEPPGTSGGYHGSLPGIHVVPKKPIVGMVATLDDKGYFLVGADGGVFTFGDAPFLGSLPGLGVVLKQPITGIVAADTDHGYFLVGRDGGVFSFGSVPFLGSLPAEGIKVDDIVGIASTPSGNGYWLVASTGKVYAFGAARHLGTVPHTTSPVSAIAGTATGGGYWVTTSKGAVYRFGNARGFGTLPAIDVKPSSPVVGMVRTADTKGYWLIGQDGGVFAFGDAPFLGALPSTGHVKDIVGAVATS